MSPRNRQRKQARGQHPSLLDEVLEHRMLLYVLAAGATLASASAAQAKIVYTPSNAVLSPGFSIGNQLQIDLNNDGTVDFVLVDTFGSTSCGDRSSWLSVIGSAASNQVLWQTKVGFRVFASALTRGMPIGSSGKFGGREEAETMAFKREFGIGSSAGGNFQNVTNRYLGVRFRINGLPYYGWIGFRSVDNFTAKLGGWAYETQPGKPILAGNTGEEGSESAELRSTDRTSLELLAAGNVAIDAWRRRSPV
jgi:hypothetical protein